MMVNYIIWDVDPEIFEIFGRGIRWYGLLLALGFYLGYMFFSKMLAKDGFSEKKINNLSMYIIIGTILGLRLGHCFFYEPEFYLAHPEKILKVWEGGLASHGGAVGILLAVGFFAWRNKVSYLGLLDRLVVIIPLAAAFVRTGNLMNSEIVGKISNVPWAFYFPRNDCPPPFDCNVETIMPRHPSQIYEALFYLLFFVVMLFLFKKKKDQLKEGFLFGFLVVVMFGFRFLVEFVKDVQVDFESEMFLNMGQILSIPFVAAGVILILIALKRGKITKFNNVG